MMTIFAGRYMIAWSVAFAFAIFSLVALGEDLIVLPEATEWPFPNGYEIIDSGGKLRKSLPNERAATVQAYIERDGARLFMSDWSYKRSTTEGIEPNWIRGLVGTVSGPNLSGRALSINVAFPGPLGTQGSVPKLIVEPNGHTDDVVALQFSLTGDRLLSISKDFTVRLWNTVTASNERTFRLADKVPYQRNLISADATQDLAKVAIAFDNGETNPCTISLLDVNSGRFLAILSLPPEIEVSTLGFALDDQILVVAHDNRILLIPLNAVFAKTPTEITAFDYLISPSEEVTTKISPNKKLLGTSYGYPGVSAVWEIVPDLSKLVELSKLSAEEIAFVDDERIILQTDFDYRTFNLSSGSYSPLFERGVGGAGTYGLAVIPGSPYYTLFNHTNIGEGAVSFYHLESHKEISIGPDQFLSVIAFSRSKQLIATGDYGGEIRIWNPLDPVFSTIVEWTEEHEKAKISGTARLSSVGGPKALVGIDQRGQKIAFSAVGSTGRPHWHTYERVFDFAELQLRHAPIYGTTDDPTTASIFGTKFASDAGGKDHGPGDRWIEATSADDQITIKRFGQTLEIWEKRSQQIIASLFVTKDDEWICWTPEGYFAASTDGGKFIAWQIDKGSDYVSEMVLGDQLFARLYRPDVVKRAILERRPASEIVREMGDTTYDVTNAVHEVPVVAFLNPSTSGSAPNARQEFRIAAFNEANNVGEIRLFHNGKSMQPDGPAQAADGRVTTTFTASLISGANRFATKAVSLTGVESAPVELTLEFEGARASANLHILAVGINEYKNPSYALDYCRPDVEALVNALEPRASGIFESVQIHELFDADATRAAIEAELAGISDVADPEDMFVFVFAGHGVMSEVEDLRAGEFYLVPHDMTQLYGDPDLMAEKGLRGSKIVEWSSRIRAQKQILILDACHSGGMVEAFAVRGAAKEKAIAQLARSTGMVVLASTRTDQFSTEMGKLGHGLFTYALLEALEGKGDLNRDSRLTVKEIEAYLNDRVPSLSEDHLGVAQYPNSFSRGQDFPVGVIK